MEMNVEKSMIMRISRESFPVQITVDQKQLDNAEYFNYLGRLIQMMQDLHVKLTPGVP
jgi:hypothetical protein